MRHWPLVIWLGAAVALAVGCGSDESDAADDAGAAGAAGAESDGGGEVGPPPGGPESCPAGACNYQSQSGCGSGQACRPAIDEASATAVPSCSNVDGPGGAGSSCTSWNDCGSGTLCITGVCRTLCCGGDWSACSADESCYGTLSVMPATSEDVYPTGVGVCLPTGVCDVFDDDSCQDPTLACHIVDARGQVGCIQRGSGVAGDACGSAGDCVQGTSCVGSLGDLECRRLCRVTAGGTPSCSGNDRCVHYVRHPPGVGECVPALP